MGGTRLIRLTEDLLELIGTRAEDGRRLSFEWGKPTGRTNTGEPVYEPVVTATDDGVHLCQCDNTPMRDSAESTPLIPHS